MLHKQPNSTFKTSDVLNCTVDDNVNDKMKINVKVFQGTIATIESIMNEWINACELEAIGANIMHGYEEGEVIALLSYRKPHSW